MSRGNTEIRFSTLTIETQMIINEFLLLKGKDSQSKYKNAIILMLEDLFKDITTINIKNLTIKEYNDYKKIVLDKQYSVTKGRFCDSLWKYLYNQNILINPKGLEFLSDQNRRIPKAAPQDEQSKGGVAIPLEIMLQIQEYTENSENTDIEFLKISFCWYMLFHTDFLSSNISKIKGNSFDGSCILVGKDEFPIPSRFYPLFAYLKGLKTNDGINLNQIVKRLGKNFKLEELNPQMIQNCKKQNLMRCSNCGNSYDNIYEKWTSINGRIVCKHCGETLKKNTSLHTNNIIQHTISVISKEEREKIDDVLSTFEEMRTKIPKTIDYLKLHEFQIKLGKLGEAYVYDMEVQKLRGTKYASLVDRDIANIPSNGYDILSYDIDGNEILIEVKTTVNREECFYLTNSEKIAMETFFEQNINYQIYWVKNILDEKKENIVLTKFSKEDIKEKLVFETFNWKIKLNS